jgi:mannan endo-1,4-beta-mannosidase
MLGMGNDRTAVDSAIDWNVYMHGIVGLMWQWNAPGTDSVYAEDSDFNLDRAFRHKDVRKLAALSAEDAATAAEKGTIAPEMLMLLTDIDAMADILRPLQNMDIPVLWRPLHEAGGGWYWWGADGFMAYQKLWELLYYRMTEYHHLDNLIWLWNGQSAAYLVPENTYDIATVDIYLQPQMQYGSRYEQFLSLKKITGGRKLLALSECSALPDLEMMQLDHSVWSFFGLWYGEYLMNPDGTFRDVYYSSNDLYNLYNSEQALTLNDFRALYQ